jgi:acyl-CoA synthetase (AMP-forming)/AMP-acid ligase II
VARRVCPRALNIAIAISWRSARLEAALFSTMGYDKEVSLSSVAPMFHHFGHHHGVIHPIYIGSTHVLVRQYKPDIVLEQLSRYKVTLFAGGPSTV